jgi:hypothetical protein
MAIILRGDQDAINWLESKMENSGAKPLRGSTRATALAYLVHLVGDTYICLYMSVRTKIEEVIISLFYTLMSGLTFILSGI